MFPCQASVRRLGTLDRGELFKYTMPQPIGNMHNTKPLGSRNSYHIQPDSELMGKTSSSASRRVGIIPHANQQVNDGMRSISFSFRSTLPRSVARA